MLLFSHYTNFLFDYGENEGKYVIKKKERKIEL